MIGGNGSYVEDHEKVIMHQLITLEQCRRIVDWLHSRKDAKIDIPMLKYCAFGVAMGNGGEEIKAMADYVTDSVEKDGIYKAFAYLNLID